LDPLEESRKFPEHLDLPLSLGAKLKV